MKKPFCFVLTIILTLTTYAQKPFLINPDSIKKHVYYFASSDLKGRKTGEDGQKLAAEYISSYFYAFGLEAPNNIDGHEAYYQKFMLFENTTYLSFMPSTEVEIKNQRNFSAGTTYLYYASNPKKGIQHATLFFPKDTIPNIDTSTFIFYSVASIDDIITTMQESWKTFGQNKFFFSTTPEVYALLQSQYPTGENLMFSESDSTTVIPFSLLRKSQPTPTGLYTKIYNAILSIPNAECIISQPVLFVNPGIITSVEDISALAGMKLPFNYNSTRTNDTIFTENVCGSIKGSEFSNEVIIIGAHYDHIGQNGQKIYFGADDNASGTAALIEIARVFSQNVKNGNPPECTLLFIAFSGEELGLWGSDMYVTRPLYPLSQTKAMLNMDMIGRPDRRENAKMYTYFLSFGPDKKGLRQQVKKSRKEQKNIKVDFHPGIIEHIGFSMGSDHYNFTKQGVNSCIFFTGTHDDYHTPRDTPDKIDYQNLAAIADLVYLTAKKLAQNKEE